MNSYFDENGIEKLICPVCRCGGFSRLSSHLYNSHPDLSKEDLLKMYPDTKFVSSNLHKKQSEATKKQWENPEYAKMISYNSSVQITEQWKDPKFRESRREVSSSMMKERWEDPEYRESKKHEAGETLKKLWKDPDFRERRIQESSKVLNSLWSNPEWRNWKSQNQSEIRIEALVTNRKKIEYINRHGNLLKFRSQFEKRLAEFFDSIDVDYEYESLSFEYEYDDHPHKYFPDFIIKNLNLIIEVKPSCYTDNEIVLKKRDSVINSGYDFMFITENDLDDLYNSELYLLLK